MIQGNVALQHKFDPAYVDQQTRLYRVLISQVPADLIVTPETAFPVPWHELPGETIEALHRFSRETRSHLLLGAPTLAADGRAYNSMVLVSPDATALSKVDKVLLMPFGEYGPTGFEAFTRQLQLAWKDLTPGPHDQAAFVVNGVRIETLICSEALTSERSLRWAKAGLGAASVLVNPDNLAWFEPSNAGAQMLQATRALASEMGRPVLRVSNTGTTSVIDHHGKLLSQLPAGQEGALSYSIQPVQGTTPFASYGPVTALLLCCALLANQLMNAVKKRGRE